MIINVLALSDRLGPYSYMASDNAADYFHYTIVEDYWRRICSGCLVSISCLGKWRNGGRLKEYR
jgi:hypothetical protein